MPVQTTRPLAFSINWQAAVNSPSMRAATAASAWPSIANTRRPLAAKPTTADELGAMESVAISEQGAFR